MTKERDPYKYYPQDYILQYVIPLIPSQITPNQITTLRFILTPFVLIILILGNYNLGIPLFIFTAFTDMVDGSLARVKRKVTDWGTTYDPVADKILIGSVTLVFILKYLSIWLGIAIIGIELFLVIIGALFRNKKSKVLHSNIFGKLKMLLQVAGIITLMIGAASGNHNYIDIALWIFIISLGFACTSTYIYLKKFLS